MLLRFSFLLLLLTGCVPREQASVPPPRPPDPPEPTWWRAFATPEEAGRIREALEKDERFSAWYDFAETGSENKESPVVAGWFEMPPLELGRYFDPSRLEDPALATAVVRHTQTFGRYDAGVVAVPASQHLATVALLEVPAADSIFAALLLNATPVGKLFALKGLYVTDRERFDQSIGPYLTSSDSVWTASGCAWRQRPVSEIAADIAAGDWVEWELDER